MRIPSNETGAPSNRLTLPGRYYNQIITDVPGFKAWWTTIASRFKDNQLVIFDTNNEYHDMDNKLVADLNQAAVDGIRAAGATGQMIWLEANAWSGAWHFVSLGLPAECGKDGGLTGVGRLWICGGYEGYQRPF